jgi:hypothetical protein
MAWLASKERGNVGELLDRRRTMGCDLTVARSRRIMSSSGISRDLKSSVMVKAADGRGDSDMCGGRVGIVRV